MSTSSWEASDSDCISRGVKHREFLHNRNWAWVCNITQAKSLSQHTNLSRTCVNQLDLQISIPIPLTEHRRRPRAPKPCLPRHNIRMHFKINRAGVHPNQRFRWPQLSSTGQWSCRVIRSPTDDASVLRLRQLNIFPQACCGSQSTVAGLFEHPRDPAQCSYMPIAEQCSSTWITRPIHMFMSFHSPLTCVIVRLAKPTTMMIDQDLHETGWKVLEETEK